MSLKRCTKCLTPETHETIIFDANGVCNVCLNISQKDNQVDWEERKKDLDELIEAYRGKYDYDCIIPYSGGKDSTWTLYYLVKEYDLKPLVVRFDHGFMRPNLEENNKRIQRDLGVDFHTFTPNWKVVQRLMLQSFIEKGDFCWHCHTGIFSYPMQVAINQNIPLIFWGEPSAEYTSYYSYDQPEEVDEQRFNRFVNLGINAEDMFLRMKGKVDKRDLKPFTYPALRDLRKINYRSVCLGSYIPWDVKAQVQIIKKDLGWSGDQVENVPPEYNYDKIECYMQGVRDYIKYIKRGYTRPTHLASIDIRHNRLSRDAGLEIIDEFEGKRPPSLDLFLEFVGLTEAEFTEIVETHVVSPHQYHPEAIKPGVKLPDYDSWSKDGAMPREEAIKFVGDWRGRRQ